MILYIFRVKELESKNAELLEANQNLDQKLKDNISASNVKKYTFIGTSIDNFQYQPHLRLILEIYQPHIDQHGWSDSFYVTNISFP